MGENLNSDVLRLIFDNICSPSYYWSTRTVYWKTYPKYELFGVSLTSKQFRAIALPFLFQEIIWDDEASPISSISHDAMRHTKRLRLRRHSHSPTQSIVNALKNMPNLLHFIFDCERFNATDVVETLCHIPSLVTLEFLQTPMISFDGIHQYPRSLQRVVWKDVDFIRQDWGIAINNAASDTTDYDMIKREFRRAIATYSYPPQKYATPMPTSFSLGLQSISHTLQHLELEVALFCQLSSGSSLEFPHLQTFILYGTGFNTRYKPFMPLLRGMPRLEDLQILLRRDDGGTTGFLLGSYPDDGQLTTEVIASYFPLLRSISLSGAFSHDSIFYLLPSSVRRISLPQHGEGDETMGRVPDEQILLEIIRAISRSEAALTELHVTMRPLPSVSFVQEVALLLPQLCTFTVTQPYLTYGSSQLESDNTKANALSLLQGLDTPHLEAYYATELPDEQVDGGMGVPERPRRGRVDLIFRMLPWSPPQRRFLPFQCRHISGPSEYFQKELQWSSCFHDISKNSPADLQVWWHIGDCIVKSSCPCQRSKRPDDHFDPSAIASSSRTDPSSDLVDNRVERLHSWFR